MEDIDINMNSTILEFLDIYKNIDELCKQIYKGNVGVSRYIEDMEKEKQGPKCVSCWEQDYRQLKHIRRVRNQLVHDVNSFQNNIVTLEDIEWANNFYSRMISCSDPFALLYQAQRKTHNCVQYQTENQSTIKVKNRKYKKKSFLHYLVIASGVALFIVAMLLALYVLIYTYI